MLAAKPDREPTTRNIASASPGGPTVQRMVLGTQLRRLREASGITREEAGDAIRASHAKISRLELGRVGFKERDLNDLLALYGLTDAQDRAPFLDLAWHANSPGWWQQYGDVLPSWFEIYLGLEQAATMISTYELQFVPGLLQTEEYARAVIMLGQHGGTREDVDRRTRLRMSRHDVLDKAEPPHLWAVVDEAALRRPLGERSAMRTQLEHLIEMNERPNVTLQVVPFHAGGHAAAGGPFTVLRFGEPDLPDIVYLEQLTSALYVDKRQDVDRYVAVMERLCVQAELPAQTADVLQRMIKEL